MRQVYREYCVACTRLWPGLPAEGGQQRPEGVAHEAEGCPGHQQPPGGQVEEVPGVEILRCCLLDPGTQGASPVNPEADTGEHYQQHEEERSGELPRSLRQLGPLVLDADPEQERRLQ